MQERAANLESYYQSLSRGPSITGACCMHLPIGLNGKRILDIACRKGQGLLKLAEAAGKQGFVAGCDWRMEYIAFASVLASNEASSDSNLAPITVRTAYPESLSSSFSLESFDVVYVNSIFNLFFDPRASLKEFLRVLQPGGILALDGLFSETPKNDSTREAGRAAGDAVDAAMSLNACCQLLAEAGFELLDVQNFGLAKNEQGESTGAGAYLLRARKPVQ